MRQEVITGADPGIRTMDFEGARIYVTVFMEDTPDLAVTMATADGIFGADIIALGITAILLITADMVMVNPIHITEDLTGGIAKMEVFERYRRAALPDLALSDRNVANNVGLSQQGRQRISKSAPNHPKTTLR
ncbi:hypothetical protein [Methylotuvimicrobium sp. KM1]|uniref:hypothetical protein n=1 Tax=Methylotuvimicrobium sp. KM1 TaxID=3377707 RepID=UPI00384D61E1